MAALLAALASCNGGRANLAVTNSEAGATTSPWLVYYDQGNCVSGLCEWQTRYFECNSGACSNGACPLPQITAPQ
jgi:hypothetical protein